MSSARCEMRQTYLWYDKILLQVDNEPSETTYCEGLTDLNVHEIVDANPSEFRELLPTFLEKGRDIITLPDLRAK